MNVTYVDAYGRTRHAILVSTHETRNGLFVEAMAVLEIGTGMDFLVLPLCEVKSNSGRLPR